MTLIIFFIVLSLLILIHELGHFIAAKRSGVEVVEFGFGFPPRVAGKKVGDTIYSINLLPFGGFVRLKGEEDFNPEPAEGWKDPKNFQTKSPLIRLIIVSGGVFMNLLLAFALYYIVLGGNGFKSEPLLLLKNFQFKYGTQNVAETVVTGVEKDSPAHLSGINFGDQIVGLESESEVTKVENVKEIQNFISDKSDNKIIVHLKNIHSGEERKVEIIPEFNDKLNRAVIGILLSKVVQISYNTREERLLIGPYHSYNMLSYSLSTLSSLIKSSFKEKDIGYVSDSISGPVGIYGLVSDILKIGGKKALINLADLTALLSLSLAFLNIMPFPALDGGRGAFLVFEGITRKRVNPKFEVWLHRIGMMILLALIILITFRDVGRIVR